MNDARLNGLIGDLYDAAFDERLWTGFADQIASVFDSTSTAIKLQGGNSGFQLLENTKNLIVPERLKSWNDEWHRRDLWVERTLPYGMSRIVITEELVSQDDIRRSGYYNEWLRYLDIHYVVGAVFPAGGDAFGVIGIHRPYKAAGYDESDRKKLAELLPHLQRAMQLGQRVAESNFTKKVGLAALENLDAGVIVIDRSARIKYSNSEAEAILRDNRELVTVGGRLSVRQAALQSRLEKILQGAIAVADGHPKPAPAALRISRLDRLPLTLAMVPLQPMRPTLLMSSEPHVLVFIRDPERTTLDASNLRELFGFTRTEAAIAAEIGNGHTLENIAKQQGVRVETVRWHLKHIFVKTGTNRQAEVAALLMRSALPLNWGERLDGGSKT